MAKALKQRQSAASRKTTPTPPVVDLEEDWPEEMREQMRAAQAKNPRVARTKRLVFGKYVVADPNICHGKLTFAGTRIFVKDVLEMVAEGMDWNSIVKDWRGSVSHEAIGEAIQLANRAFLEHAAEYPVESMPE